MRDEEKITCKNCGTVFASKHCPECGQEAQTRRFDVKETAKGLFLVFVVAENTFYKTAGSLFYRPGHMVREYLTGERVKYLRPVKMLICLITAYILLTNFVFPADSNNSTSLESIVHISDDFPVVGRVISILSKMLENTVIHSLLSAFLFSIPFRWAFRKCKIRFKDGTTDSLNIAEHFCTLVYLSCQTMILSFVYLISRQIFHHEPYESLSLLLAIFLHSWCYKQLLGISWAKSVRKVVVAGSLTIIAILTFLLLVFMIFYLVNPDILELKTQS